jgi:AbrB family looped-hinge helix DNA binding protein
MSTVVISPKYQVVIPRDIRKKNDVKPGQKMQIISFDDRIELIPVYEMSQTRGFLKGRNSVFVRDEEDRA